MVKEGLDIHLEKRRSLADGVRVDELDPEYPDLLHKGLRTLIVRYLEEGLQSFTGNSHYNGDDRNPEPPYHTLWKVRDYITGHRESVIEITNTDGYQMVLSHPRPRYTNTTWHFQFAGGGAFKQREGIRVPFPSGNRAHYAFYGSEPESGEDVIRPIQGGEFPARVLKFRQHGEWVYRKEIRPRTYGSAHFYRDKIDTIIQRSIDRAVSDYKRGVR